MNRPQGKHVRYLLAESQVCFSSALSINTNLYNFFLNRVWIVEATKNAILHKQEKKRRGAK